MTEGATQTGTGTTDAGDVPMAYAATVGGPHEIITAVDYAGPQTFDLAALVPALRLMLPLSVLSGLCVATCWFCMYGSSGGFFNLAALVHGAVYAATLCTAVFAGVRLDQAAAGLETLRAPGRRIMDVIAGAGLAVIGLTPAAMIAFKTFVYRNPTIESLGLPLVGIAFALMTVTVYRHRLLYTPLSRVMRSAGHVSVGRLLSTVGWTKTIYEGIWLLCCTLPLIGTSLRFTGFGDLIIYVAIGAAVGCIGFAAVWIMMIVAHTKALNAAKRSSTGYR